MLFHRIRTTSAAYHFRPLARVVVPLSCKQEVVGSSPTGGAEFSSFFPFYLLSFLYLFLPISIFPLPIFTYFYLSSTPFCVPVFIQLCLNPRRACAARVTVVVLCVCLSVCLSVSTTILGLQATRRLMSDTNSFSATRARKIMWRFC